MAHKITLYYSPSNVILCSSITVSQFGIDGLQFLT